MFYFLLGQHSSFFLRTPAHLQVVVARVKTWDMFNQYNHLYLQVTILIAFIYSRIIGHITRPFKIGDLEFNLNNIRAADRQIIVKIIFFIDFRSQLIKCS